MGILSNTIFNNKTISMGDIVAEDVYVYGSVTVKASTALSQSLDHADYSSTITVTANNNAKLFLLNSPAYATMVNGPKCNSAVYISGNILYASSFNGTANNAASLGSLSYKYYLPLINRRKWWKCAHTLDALGAEASITPEKSGDTLANIFFGMGENYTTQGSSTTIDVGDYVFDDVGHIGVVSNIVSSTEIKVFTVWESVRTWTCLEEETLITMADWSQKPIKDITDGEMIMGYDFEKNEPTPAVVLLNTITSDEDHANYFIFDDGSMLNCTDCHELYSVDKGRSCWIDELSEGERFISIDGNIKTLKAIHKRIFTYDKKQFYQLVSSNNTYFANGILNAMAPHSKYNWLVEYHKRSLNNEIFDIFKKDAEEYTSLSFLVRDDDFRSRSINNLENAKLIYKKLVELHDYLKQTDYVSYKQMEEVEIDSDVILKRQEARDEINRLQKEVYEKYNISLDEMMKEKSPLKEDVLMPIDQKLSKYFHMSCKRDNENLEIFKKYFCK